MLGDKGQTLLEMVVVIAVALLVVSSLTFATIASLRNAQFAKNQVQATKYAQEGIEKVRSIRDRNGPVIFTYSSGGGSSATTKFSDLWSVNMNSNCSNGPCFFRLDPSANSLTQGIRSITDINAGPTDYETLSGFKRQIQINDTTSWSTEKTVTVIVVWNDFAGDHQSQLTTILRKIQ